MSAGKAALKDVAAQEWGQGDSVLSPHCGQQVTPQTKGQQDKLKTQQHVEKKIRVETTCYGEQGPTVFSPTQFTPNEQMQNSHKDTDTTKARKLNVQTFMYPFTFS